MGFWNKLKSVFKRAGKEFADELKETGKVRRPQNNRNGYGPRPSGYRQRDSQGRNQTGR